MTEIIYYPVCHKDDIPNGERLLLTIDDDHVVILNIDGEYFAIRDVCTHDDGPLGEGELEDHRIVCPRHGAQFDVRTGEVLSLPAVKDVPSYPIRVVEDQIEIGIEVQKIQDQP